jgi:Domain of unknown function (DUF4386)
MSSTGRDHDGQLGENRIRGWLVLPDHLRELDSCRLSPEPVLEDPHYIVSAGADTRIVFGCLLDLINAIACIGTAVTLFPVVKRQHEGVALGFVTARVLEGWSLWLG